MRVHMRVCMCVCFFDFITYFGPGNIPIKVPFWGFSLVNAAALAPTLSCLLLWKV